LRAGAAESVSFSKIGASSGQALYRGNGKFDMQRNFCEVRPLDPPPPRAEGALPEAGFKPQLEGLSPFSTFEICDLATDRSNDVPVTTAPSLPRQN
jgi:hypothetical protein